MPLCQDTLQSHSLADLIPKASASPEVEDGSFRSTLQDVREAAEPRTRRGDGEPANDRTSVRESREESADTTASDDTVSTSSTPAAESTGEGTTLLAADLELATEAAALVTDGETLAALPAELEDATVETLTRATTTSRSETANTPAASGAASAATTATTEELANTQTLPQSGAERTTGSATQTDSAVTENAPQATAPAARAAVKTTPGLATSENTTAPTHSLVDDGPAVQLGSYFDDSRGSAGGQGERDPRFHLLENETAKTPTSSHPRLVHTDSAPAATATASPAAAPTPPAGVEAQPAPATPTPTASGPDVSVTAIDGASASVTGRAVANELARVETVLRTEPGEEAAFARRVNRLVRRALARGESEVRVRIDPPHLGRVDVTVRMGEDQRIGVVMRVDHESVRATLSQHISDLEQALADHGYEAGQIDIELRNGDASLAGRDGDPDDAHGTSRGTGAHADADGLLLDSETDTHEAVPAHLGAMMDLRG